LFRGCFLAVAANILIWPLAVGAQTDAEAVIEVAAFGVTPVQVARSLGDSAGREAISIRVARGDDWRAVLGRLTQAKGTAQTVFSGLDIGRLPELKPGRYLRLASRPGAQGLLIEYLADQNSAFDIHITPDAPTRIIERLPGADLIDAARRDVMKSSLFAATDAVGLPDAVALGLVDIFAEEIDFLRDLGQGYRCALVYEMTYQDGIARPGRILAAEFKLAGRRGVAYLHRFANGESGYFDTEGNDINRVLRPDTSANTAQVRHPERGRLVDAAASFRRSPLEFTRVTSAPSAARYHPILKEWRAHRGTDYGAPIGTRVKATADGEVFFVGVRGSYGNLVILRHYNRFTTFYGHLNGFAPGLSTGDRVRKGDVIGFVGMTGLATGPHLHYELRDDLAPGALSVPLVVRTIGADDMARFRARNSQLRQQLDYAYRANLVILD
jgi:murein DD-endopeptidase MepM/ murein hydrolase activator NlpD